MDGHAPMHRRRAIQIPRLRILRISARIRGLPRCRCLRYVTNVTDVTNVIGPLTATASLFLLFFNLAYVYRLIWVKQPFWIETALDQMCSPNVRCHFSSRAPIGLRPALTAFRSSPHTTWAGVDKTADCLFQRSVLQACQNEASLLLYFSGC